MSALDEKGRAERALKDLQKVQGEDMVMSEFVDISSNWRISMKELTFLRVCFLLQLPAKDQEISSLEDTVAALKEDYERCLSASAASQKDLQENLVSSKHQLLRVQEQLLLAEKVRSVSLASSHRLESRSCVLKPSCVLHLQELEKKFQQTAAYRNMKEILTKKNEQIKELRKELQR